MAEPTIKMTDEELALVLTPEEMAAIKDSDEDDKAALAALAAIAGDDDEEDDADDEDDSGDESAAASPAAAPAAATPADAAAAPAAQAEAEPDPAPAPAAYRAELPADHAEKKAAAKSRLADLNAKFKDGEIEVSDYEAQRETVDSELDALRRAEIKAEIAEEMNSQSAEAQWASAIKRQFAAAKGQGVDYAADEEKRADLDGFVRSLGANPKNADKSMDWFMSEANKRVLALHDIKPAPAPAAAAPAAPAVDPAKTRKPPVAAVTPSLSNVPGGDGPGDVGGDEFGDLDGLDGLEFEAALARLSESQRSKYLSRV